MGKKWEKRTIMKYFIYVVHAVNIVLLGMNAYLYVTQCLKLNTLVWIQES